MNAKLTKLFFILVHVLIAFSCFAQEELKEGKIKINNRQYTISKSDPRFNTGGIWILDNENLILNQNHVQSRYKRVEPIEFNSMSLNDAIIDILDITQIREFTGRPILIQVYPNDSGIIVATEYYVPAKHPITIEDIDQINNYIKKNVSFKMPSNIVAGDVIAPISLPVHFKKLIKDYENRN